MPPALVATASPHHRFAGWWARPLSWVGFVVLALMMLIGPLWAIVFGGMLALGPIAARRARRMRWEIDQRGPEARFRWHVDARRSAPLADIGGVIEQVVPGATSRGIPITRDSEHWHLVGHDGRWLGTAATIGLDPADVERARALLPGQRIAYPVARRIGALPAGMPWYARHPGRAVLAAVVVSGGLMLLLVLTTEQLSWLALLAG